MLLDIEFIKPNTIKLSYINKYGFTEFFETEVPKNQMFEWKLNLYRTKHSVKEYESWDGKPLYKEQADVLTKTRMFQYLNDFHKEFLDKNVFNNENFPKVLFFDIEILTDDDGFPKPELALKPIVTISFCVDDEITVYYWDKDNRNIKANEIEYKINEYIQKNNPEIKRTFKFSYRKFDTEKELLFHSIKDFFNIYPVWSGWNVRKFDYVYIKNRLRVLGMSDDLLSPNKRFKGKFQEPYHTALLDYYELFLKYDRSIKVRENFTLDFISKSVTGIPKIKYSGTLDNLLKNDLDNFILYNCIDSILVSLINDKLKILKTYNILCNFSRIEATLGINSSLAIESALFNKFYSNKKICVPKFENESTDGEKYEGAYVFAASGTINDYVIGCDYTSMYPTIMMQWNIGPETFITKINKSELELVLNGDFSPLHKFGIKDKSEITITSSGAVFTKRVKSVVADLVEYLFNKRKEVKKEIANIEIIVAGLKEYDETKITDAVLKMKEKIKETTLLNEEIKNLILSNSPITPTQKQNELERLKNLIEIYSIEENAYKIYINSMYGVMGFSKFYFFNKDIAEGITLQGQTINKATINSINYYFKEYFWKDKNLHNILKLNNIEKPQNIKDAVIYGDTDSTYVTFQELMFLKPNHLDEVEFIKTIWDNSLRPFLLKMQQKLSEKYFTESKLDLKFEKILRRMIIFAKKKYVTETYWKIPDIRYQPLQKVEFVGVEVVKSDLPPYIRKKIMEFLKNMLLYGKEYKKEDIKEFYNKIKKEFYQQPPDVVAMAKKISDYEKYIKNDNDKIELNKKCPIHIKSGAVYNYVIRKYKLTKKYRFINSGDKINFIYIKNLNNEFPANSSLNVFGYIPNEFPIEVSNLIKVDYDAQFKVVFEDVIGRYISEIYNIKDLNSTSLDTYELF